jgi:hypothetical protein
MPNKIDWSTERRQSGDFVNTTDSNTIAVECIANSAMLRSYDDLVQACKDAGGMSLFGDAMIACNVCTGNQMGQDIVTAFNLPECVAPLYTFEELQKEATRAVMNESATNRAMLVLSDQYDAVECTGTLLDYTRAPNPSLAFGRFDVVNVCCVVFVVTTLSMCFMY